MRIKRQNALTACGVARLLVRAIRANYAPPHQQAEMERLVEYLQDLAVSRANEAELPGQTTDATGRAQGDAAWLDTLATELEAASLPSHIAKKS
jgi:hypothetical protein